VSRRVVQTPPPPSAPVPEAEPAAGTGRLQGIWHQVRTRFHGGEGASPRRVAALVLVFGFVALTLVTPLRTFLEVRSDAAAEAATTARLTAEIQELEERKDQLEDPDYIRRQAGERLGYVPRGSTPYIVQLPPERLPEGAREAGEDSAGASHDPAEPWYTNLWGSITTEPAETPADPDRSGDHGEEQAPPPMVPAEDHDPEAEGE